MLYSITSCQKLSDIFKKHQQHLPGPQLHIIPLSFNLSFAIKKNWPKKQTYIQMKPSFAARCNMLQFPLWTTLKLYKSALYMSTALSRWAVYVPHADVHWYGSWSVKQIKGLLYFADHCVIGSLSYYSFTLSYKLVEDLSWLVFGISCWLGFIWHFVDPSLFTVYLCLLSFQLSMFAMLAVLTAKL